MADMSGAKTEGCFKTWPWGDLIEKIRYKAEERGIRLRWLTETRQLTPAQNVDIVIRKMLREILSFSLAKIRIAMLK